MAEATNGNAMAGEAGQRGQDRQPVKNAGNHVEGTAPEGAQVAGAGQVRGRSEEARKAMTRGEARKDMLDPGPGREEAERSKGNAHHDQHELEPEMNKKVEGL
ncbi:MAG TPA: hypothetical protein VH253_12630 [Phycisphaerae bacterium]|nr:hypothetical protein [Phycisphaerae bacterium]